MAGSAGDNSGSEPLQRVLRDVEAELRHRLRDACEAEATGISTESAVAVRRLEDSLLAAAVAAEQTIALRRRIEQEHASTPAKTTTADSPEEANEPLIKLREFRDADGRLWRAWPVTPRQTRSGRTAERYLGEFHQGWICFEALESNARRRLPKHPEHWSELKDPELCQLLEQAIKAPERKRPSAGDESPRPPIH
jgi:hypothetical protein